MTREEFFEEIKNALETDVDISSDTALADIPEWDSLAIMSIMALVKRTCDVGLAPTDFAAFKTVGDIATKAGL